MAARYREFAEDQDAIDPLLIDCFLQAQRTSPAELMLDLDATEDPGE